MPVTLGEDTHHTFIAANQPLSSELIAQYIKPTERTNSDDEFTEYVPCFSFDDTEQFVAVVWWKAELMNYEYVLATFDEKGTLIDRKVIAGTSVGADGSVTHAVAIINEEWEIATAEGRSSDGNRLFDPTSSKMRHWEILATGKIVEG